MKVSLLLRDSVFMNRCLRAVHNGNSTLSDWCSGDFMLVTSGFLIGVVNPPLYACQHSIVRQRYMLT